MKTRIPFLLAATTLLSAGAVSGASSPADLTPAQPVIPDHRFNLKDFGAVGDSGATLNLTAPAGRTRAGLIAGLPEMPAENITLENVSIEAPTGLRIANTKGVTLRNVHITAASGPDVIADASVQGLTRK